MNRSFSRREMFRLGGLSLATAGAFAFGRSSERVSAELLPATPEVPTDIAELLLRIEIGGGLMPPEYVLTNFPVVSVYADGRVISTGPMIEIYPQPALPNLRVLTLTAAGVDRVLEEAKTAGLFDGSRTYENNFVADAPTTVFTLAANGVSAVVSAYALGIGEEQIPDSADREARAKLMAFQNFMSDLAGNLDATDIAVADAAYEIDRLRVYARPIDQSNPPWQDPELAQEPVPWPLATDLADFGDPLTSGPLAGEMQCAAIEGDDAATLVKALSSANQLTPWESDGVWYQLWIRPLFPDEVLGCS